MIKNIKIVLEEENGNVKDYCLLNKKGIKILTGTKFIIFFVLFMIVIQNLYAILSGMIYGDYTLVIYSMMLTILEILCLITALIYRHIKSKKNRKLVS